MLTSFPMCLLICLEKAPCLLSIYLEQFYHLSLCLNPLTEAAESYTEQYYSREIVGMKRPSALCFFTYPEAKFLIFCISLDAQVPVYLL